MGLKTSRTGVSQLFLVCCYIIFDGKSVVSLLVSDFPVTVLEETGAQTQDILSLPDIQDKLSQLFLKCSAECSGLPDCLGITIYKLDTYSEQSTDRANSFSCVPTINEDVSSLQSGKLFYKIMFRDKLPKVQRRNFKVGNFRELRNINSNEFSKENDIQAVEKRDNSHKEESTTKVSEQSDSLFSDDSAPAVVTVDPKNAILNSDNSDSLFEDNKPVSTVSPEISNHGIVNGASTASTPITGDLATVFSSGSGSKTSKHSSSEKSFEMTSTNSSAISPMMIQPVLTESNATSSSDALRHLANSNIAVGQSFGKTSSTSSSSSQEQSSSNSTGIPISNIQTTVTTAMGNSTASLSLVPNASANSMMEHITNESTGVFSNAKNAIAQASSEKSLTNIGTSSENTLAHFDAASTNNNGGSSGNTLTNVSGASSENTTKHIEGASSGKTSTSAEGASSGTTSTHLVGASSGNNSSETFSENASTNINAGSSENTLTHSEGVSSGTTSANNNGVSSAKTITHVEGASSGTTSTNNNGVSSEKTTHIEEASFEKSSTNNNGAFSGITSNVSGASSGNPLTLIEGALSGTTSPNITSTSSGTTSANINAASSGTTSTNTNGASSGTSAHFEGITSENGLTNSNGASSEHVSANINRASSENASSGINTTSSEKTSANTVTAVSGASGITEFGKESSISTVAENGGAVVSNESSKQGFGVLKSNPSTSSAVSGSLENNPSNSHSQDISSKVISSTLKNSSNNGVISESNFDSTSVIRPSSTNEQVSIEPLVSDNSFNSRLHIPMGNSIVIPVDLGSLFETNSSSVDALNNSTSLSQVSTSIPVIEIMPILSRISADSNSSLSMGHISTGVVSTDSTNALEPFIHNNANKTLENLSSFLIPFSELNSSTSLFATTKTKPTLGSSSHNSATIFTSAPTSGENVITGVPMIILIGPETKNKSSEQPQSENSESTNANHSLDSSLENSSKGTILAVHIGQGHKTNETQDQNLISQTDMNTNSISQTSGDGNISHEENTEDISTTKNENHIKQDSALTTEHSIQVNSDKIDQSLVPFSHKQHISTIAMQFKPKTPEIHSEIENTDNSKDIGKTVFVGGSDATKSDSITEDLSHAQNAVGSEVKNQDGTTTIVLKTVIKLHLEDEILPTTESPDSPMQITASSEMSKINLEGKTSDTMTSPLKLKTVIKIKLGEEMPAPAGSSDVSMQTSKESSKINTNFEEENPTATDSTMHLKKVIEINLGDVAPMESTQTKASSKITKVQLEEENLTATDSTIQLEKVIDINFGDETDKTKSVDFPTQTTESYGNVEESVTTFKQLLEHQSTDSECLFQDTERYLRNIRGTAFSMLNGCPTLLSFVSGFQSHCVGTLMKNGTRGMRHIESIFPGFPSGIEVEAAGFLNDRLYVVDSSTVQNVWSYKYDSNTRRYSEVSRRKSAEATKQELFQLCQMDTLSSDTRIKAFTQVSLHDNSCIIFDDSRTPIISETASDEARSLAKAISFLLEAEFVNYVEAVFSWLDESFISSVYVYGSEGNLYRLFRNETTNFKWQKGNYELLPYPELPLKP